MFNIKKWLKAGLKEETQLVQVWGYCKYCKQNVTVETLTC